MKKKSSAQKFPESVRSKIGSYVYVLRDPRNEEIFYIGKGSEDRVFCHANDELDLDESQEAVGNKLLRIREIRNEGREVEHYILRHGLSEKEAFEVEAALIDFVGLANLTNLVRGLGSDDRGRSHVRDIIAKYAAEKAVISEQALLITINQYYRPEMTADILYEVTRGIWKLSKRRENAKYAFAVYRGIIREVYRIDSWHPQTEDSGPRKEWIHKLTGNVYKGDQVRWEFEGEIAEDLQHYKYCSTENYQVAGSQNPIRYVNC
ncbi:hypothetical protein BH20ACI2_BH20ACI2_11010 [soil metagenome]